MDTYCHGPHSREEQGSLLDVKFVPQKRTCTVTFVYVVAIETVYISNGNFMICLRIVTLHTAGRNNDMQTRT